ncbi:hypothetical protein [Aliiroseovarius sp. YM-037]|uniref:hypothetical protein n=1 Tax=Aliiroseovarius sp. YM-037 TaxID=3341728 RepID=UPI003A80034B
MIYTMGLRFVVLAVCLTFGSWASAQTSDSGQENTGSEIVERAENTIDLLQPLLDLETSLEDQIATANEVPAEEGDEAAAEELERLRSELSDVQEQISVVVTGISEQGYQAMDESEFDLNSELQSLIEPFVLVLNEATNDARELERARRNQDVAVRRLDSAALAIANIKAVLAQEPSSAVAERLNNDLSTWNERLTLHETQVDALSQQIEDLQSERVTVGRNVNSTFQRFFRDRGISLILGIGAFLGVLIIARLLLFLAQKAISRRTKEKTFAMRLGGILFVVFSVFASFGAMVVVFNMRNDWLLLGLAMLLFIAALWVALKMLPNLLEQLSVLLNLGAVQEGERVLFNGVPFKVARLSFFTDLVNPALDGGEFTLPVREIVSMHSRPAAVDEAWFPSNKGDWVKLSDDTAGQVVAQTPEMVVVELLGGSRVTYQTEDFLATNPENLSGGYRIEIEFGIGYRHQADATDGVIDAMRRGVREHFEALLPPSELQKVDVEFLRAGASSLDYEVEIDVAGTAAHRFEELERELARCMVGLANKHNWEIPFQQVVIHNPANTRAAE